MKLTIILALAISNVLLAGGLPEDSQDLLAKLDDFSKTEREKVESVISEKTEAVVKILESHLDRETKAGNLESALAIKNKLSELKGEKPAEDLALQDRLINTTWAWRPDERITFLPDGKARWSHSGKEEFTWQVTSASERIISGITSLGLNYRIIFTASLDAGRIEERNAVRNTHIISAK